MLYFKKYSIKFSSSYSSMIHFISKLLLHVQPDQGFVKISIYCVLYMNLNCPAAQPNDLKAL